MVDISNSLKFDFRVHNTFSGQMTAGEWIILPAEDLLSHKMLVSSLPEDTYGGNGWLNSPICDMSVEIEDEVGGKAVVPLVFVKAHGSPTDSEGTKLSTEGGGLILTKSFLLSALFMFYGGKYGGLHLPEGTKYLKLMSDTRIGLQGTSVIVGAYCIELEK